tara:strand:- start:2463 stop:2972 length:510 start_codon:yes stop_codon:yes gene_type:complete
MKNVSQSMQCWMKTNLSHLNVFDCVYCHINIHDRKLMTIPAHLNWHHSYIEQSLDLNISSRLNVGVNYWKDTDIIHKKYKEYTQKESFCKIDIIKKTENGFEIFSVAHNYPISIRNKFILKSCFTEMSKEAKKIIKLQKSILTDLRPYKQVKLKYYGLDTKCFDHYLNL